MARFVTGNTFSTSDQVTAAKLNTAINDAAISADSVDDSTIELDTNKIRVKDGGITADKLSMLSTSTAALTLTGSAPSVTFDDSDNSGTSPIISSDSADGDLSIISGKANAETIIQTGNSSGTATTRLQAGEGVSKNNAGSTASGIKVTGSIYATVDIVADGDVVADLDSDIRLKENVVPIQEPLEKVNSLSGNTFEWNNKSEKFGTSDIGLIAQEVQEIFPCAVREKENGYLKVNYAKIIPLLVQCIKELNTKVQVLESKAHTHGTK
jgi:hypothetical protein